jgi:hypothetical protein
MSRYATIPLFLFFLLLPIRVEAETVIFPFFIDFPLLKTLVLKRNFNGPDQSALVLDQNNKCQRIVLSDPTFREKDKQISFETGLYARMGAFVEPECILPIEYTGRVSVLLRPAIDESWVLTFSPKDLTLYEDHGNPLHVNPDISPLMSRALTAYIESVKFDLGPSIQEVKSFILPLIPPSYQERARRMLKSMRPAGITTTKRGLEIEIVAEVELVHRAETEAKALSELEIEAIIHTWETMDAFLVQLITSMTTVPLTPSEKHGLASALLESRYDFVIQWSKGELSNDFVREQFKKVWGKIAKILRQHLSVEPSDSALRHLAFYTASEALTILDRIGPSLGIDISQEGLLRLARLLTGNNALQLRYQSKINRRLREIFGLGETLPSPHTPVEEPEAAPDATDPSPRNNGGGPVSWIIEELSPGRAWAQSDGQSIPIAKLREWLLRPANADVYFSRVKHLLNDASHRILEDAGSISDDSSFFKDLVLAVSWQESCFRQFVVKDEKVVYLRSYNGTSVGLMQVNERVWRGLYDLYALRWDIRYNAQAGCEILDLYLRQYALPEVDAGDTRYKDTLARLVYALYNGGPGQIKKFRHRHEKGKYFLSDRLFHEKYRWVTEDAWTNLRQCLTDS